MSRKIPCVVMRGGTSKGVILNADDLPRDPAERDRTILAIFGSPDSRQINGLGGADPLTSKVAIISRSARLDADIDYLFGQVGIDKPEVSYANNCGNISSAVGPYAVEAGLVTPTEPFITVRIFNVNTQKRILAQFRVENGKTVTEGECRIDGVPGTGAPIRLTFCDPAGGATGKLLPTGKAIDLIDMGGEALEVSIVDCGNLYALVPATGLGLTGQESPAEIEQRKAVAENVDALRREVADCLTELGAVSAECGRALRTALKVAIVAGAAQVKAADGSVRQANVVSRILNPGKVHKSYAVTGAIAMAGAAALPDSVVGRLLPPAPGTGQRRVCIVHPQGTIEAEIEYETGGSVPVIKGATVTRTARCIMEGVVHLPGSSVATTERSVRGA
jgi:2-methylaconitate cis-trans-isomerase PrpF